MDTRIRLAEKKTRLGDKTYEEKRVHSQKRLDNDNVNFPDWKTTMSCHDNRTTQLVVSYKEGKKISKLREPRNLYELHHGHSSINIPRWPLEMKILSDHPYHLQYHPSHPEIFYNQDNSVDESEFEFPILTEVENGTLVYENSIVKTNYFDRSRPGGTTIKTKYPLITEDSNTLHFESRFESGNLFKAIKIGSFDYQLWLRTDLYTKKYTQWYYFRVENTIAGVEYRFTIMNLMKSSSLYSEGMKPLLYSEEAAKNKRIGWQRVGENIKYYKNKLKREDQKGLLKGLYSLSWTVRFSYTGDTCYFAHCYPYTYTDLQEYLRKLSRDPRRSYYCKQKILTRSLAGNFIYVITITNPSKCPSDAKNKRAVILTARVHPGESNSSWMMKGLLDYLTSDKQDAKLLRDTFVFKIIPMLNPDGVIVGNYRCSLSGRDLNRNYKTELKDDFPPVWYTREMIRRINEERQVILYCDLHGHSRQHNVFIYGCEDRRNVVNGFKERVFPMMMSKNCQDKFCFNRCKFKVQKSKSGTGRIVMWNMGIQNSYTVEATFCGSTLGLKAGEHFSILDYELMGYHLCDTLLDYCDPDMSKYLLVLRELDIYVKDFILGRLKENGEASANMISSDIDIDRDYISESSSEGSDSSVSDGPPMQVLYSKGIERHSTKKKKKRLKTRKERNKRRTKTLISSQKKKSEQLMKNGNTLKNSPTTSNELKEKKDSRSSPSLTPRNHTKHEHPKRLTVPHHLNDVKVRHYLESMRIGCIPYKQSDVFNVSTHQLRLPTSGLCLGLAPAAFSTPHSASLKRWSVRHNSTSGSMNEQEDSFIGQYMTKQMRQSTKDGKINRPESSSSQNIKNTTDYIRQPIEKYCLYHSSMLRQNSDRKGYYEARERITGDDTDHEGSNRDNEGLNRDNEGSNRDNKGSTRDHKGSNRDNVGSTRDHKGLSRDNEGLNRDNEGSTRDHKGLNRESEGLNKDLAGLSRDRKGSNRDDEGLNKDRVGLDKYHEGLNRDHEGMNRDYEGMNRDQEVLDMDRERFSKSMKVLDDKEGQDEKKLSSITRRKSESNLPPLCGNNGVFKNEKKYVRRVHHYTMNKHHDSREERQDVKPQNTFPDLRANSKLTKEENRIPRTT